MVEEKVTESIIEYHKWNVDSFFFYYYFKIWKLKFNLFCEPFSAAAAPVNDI